MSSDKALPASAAAPALDLESLQRTARALAAVLAQICVGSFVAHARRNGERRGDT